MCVQRWENEGGAAMRDWFTDDALPVKRLDSLPDEDRARVEEQFDKAEREAQERLRQYEESRQSRTGLGRMY
jgi:hypothetical protein